MVSSAANMPTQLEMAMDTTIRTFHQYSCREGDRFKLSKGELKMLLQRELTDFLSVSPAFLPHSVQGGGSAPWRHPETPSVPVVSCDSTLRSKIQGTQTRETCVCCVRPPGFALSIFPVARLSKRCEFYLRLSSILPLPGAAKV